MNNRSLVFLNVVLIRETASKITRPPQFVTLSITIVRRTYGKILWKEQISFQESGRYDLAGRDRRRPFMRVPRASLRPTIHPERQSEAERWQQGHLLLFVRIACIVVVALALGLFVVTFPAYFAHLHQICTTASCSFGQNTVSTAGQLSVIGLRALHSLGLSVSAYAILESTLVIISELPCVVVAAFLLWRKSDNWTALLVAVLLVTWGQATLLRTLLC
jgi:hypothetical protein